MTEPDVTECLQSYPHSALPKLAQHRSHRNAGDANHSYVNASGVRCHRFRLSSLVASHPLPINAPHQFAGASRVDPVARLPLAKEAHRRRLHQLHNFHQLGSSDKSHKKQMQSLGQDNDAAASGRKGDAPKIGNIQLNIVREFAEELERDPDAHFAGTYDWYCTGSALLTFADDEGADWLVHVEDAAGRFDRLSELQVF